eukprot:CAMPEP_0113425518 /NCGR_PEP_ID=MMETSP0013_2-20120614/30215_1 /TAXON_ID=2843 ORGANISM="Skeletonema costatum, Strain 1716" /NCGR_SAMPLE_ID=MMETSP0013_2 /ASSEMBLY_ACC=CAM_ASM_000158 /LENGTH=897 /DNA_ID=CAMNT_0000313691 /DNA_START=37 /DNA_END=2727 /DNA_ORIENTATION=+ /assembly_acc=CAM_ASM_000158
MSQPAKMDQSISNQEGVVIAPLPTPMSLPIPTAIKPTSRARTYRIPNTSDAATGAHAGDNENAAVEKNTTSSSHHATSESFLWATREIAALDFLMNVPLQAEREIVRAGLSGERWQRKHAKKDLNTSAPTKDVLISSASQYETQHEDEENIRHLSSFDVTGSSYVDSDTNTATTGSASALGSTELRNHAAGGRWWDKLILKDKRFFSAANQQMQRRIESEMEEKELERPTESPSLAMMTDEHDKLMNSMKGNVPRTAAAARGGGVPGRRLDGRDAPAVSIPNEFRCRPPKTVARQAAVREWEIKVAWHGITGEGAENSSNALLDARVFFSAKKSYPVAIFSTIKYEPQKEAAARRRKKLEELGGGGTQFVLPERDWRGISYRALLPREVAKPNRAFNRLLAGSRAPEEMIRRSPSSGNHLDSSMSGDSYDSDDNSESSSEESGTYVCGLLDDPEWVSGRHRHVMVGDKNVGPIVSSTIQFVKPSELKRELNNKFRERFDGWEPPKSQRKYIGAKVIEGVYTLMDPTETTRDDDDGLDDSLGRQTSGERNVIRMPPSLTLSKIRSLKQQALMACIRSKIEISTLALACVYFERLCLDCRVDKSNRRLSFAASLLLAAKVNESNSMIAFEDPGVETSNRQNIIESFVKPSKKSTKIFESLVVFFTHDWSLSLKELFAAEWIVFTALGFSLKARPSEVAFHFRRLLRVLEWNARSYLGSEMYRQWQDSLVDESLQKERREARREREVQKKDRKLLRLQRKLHQTQAEEASSRRSSTTTQSVDALETPRRLSSPASLEDYKAPKLVATPRPKTAPEPDNAHADLASPARRGGLFSRLARPKNASYGKDLDKISNEKEMTHSSSVPNLRSSSLTGEKMDLFHTIHESEHEDTHVQMSDDGFF